MTMFVSERPNARTGTTLFALLLATGREADNAVRGLKVRLDAAAATILHKVRSSTGSHGDDNPLFGVQSMITGTESEAYLDQPSG